MVIFFLYFAVYSILFRNINIWNVDKRKQDQKTYVLYITVYFQKYFVLKKNQNKLNFLKKDELTIGDLHVGRPYLLMIVIAH